MARTNFQYEKRQRELEKKRKAEEKAKRKAEAKTHKPGEPGEVEDGADEVEVVAPEGDEQAG
ncbi:hypothetical protein GCM10027321_24470 [Massilia terrae]|uniref:Uncharacterized protein n=1 Tax=Massilia terrae TaxID=1811224 RepID=A0ABT2CWU2_9BURK|nr:hypothetical protein [Massilia terrae]MCS0658455.1 hypothetical protein [Massilia terrae]